MKSQNKSLVGTVVSHKMQKTVVVKVERLAKDQQFYKTVAQEKKFKAHDEKDECRVGDQVLLIGTRPLSREKRWRVAKILKKSVLSGEPLAGDLPTGGE